MWNEESVAYFVVLCQLYPGGTKATETIVRTSHYRGETLSRSFLNIAMMMEAVSTSETSVKFVIDFTA
jgi:hypothetical protein